MHRTMISLHKKHGKLVRTGPNEVSISDLTAIRKIYGKHDRNSRRRSLEFLSRMLIGD